MGLSKALGILLVLTFFVFAVSGAHAQSLDTSEFDEAYQEYRLALEEYQKAHQEYSLARSQFLRFGTLTSRENAHEKTVRMLEAADEVIITHLRAVLIRLEMSENINNLQKAESRLSIQEEISWFTDHQANLSSSLTLNDLERDARIANTRYEQFYLKVVYQALAAISSGKLETFQERFSENFEELNIKLTNIRLDERDEYRLNEFELKRIDDWLLEIRNLVMRSEEKQLEADVKILELQLTRRVTRGTYDNLIKTLSESFQHLKQASLYVNEIVKDIKTQG